MKTRSTYRFPDEQERKIQKAIRLEWFTIGFMLTIIAVIYTTMGNSQAMKAAWIEDILSLIPPIAFLIAIRFRSKEPNETFPYGYQRATSISFLVASTALFIFGAYIFYDSITALLKTEHPTIGMTRMFGLNVWEGWVMIAALAYSAMPPVILGRLKISLARETHQKTLYTDADMNKADWLTALAGILGILGIGAGWWWADSVAAGVISLDILKDGISNLKEVTGDLMDRRPVKVDRKVPDDITDRLHDRLNRLDWVREAAVRLREEGSVLVGEAFIVPLSEDRLTEKIDQARQLAEEFDWRIYDFVVTVVPDLNPIRTETGNKV